MVDLRDKLGDDFRVHSCPQKAPHPRQRKVQATTPAAARDVGIILAVPVSLMIVYLLTFTNITRQKTAITNLILTTWSNLKH